MHRTLPFSALLLLAAAAPLAAQQTIEVRRRETGELTATDPWRGGTYYDMWQFSARAGATYVVTLRSADFDAFLAVGYCGGGYCETCDTDDDGLGGTDSRLAFTAQVSGMHRIRVASFRGDETGAYTLGVDSASDSPPAPDPEFLPDTVVTDTVVTDTVAWSAPAPMPSSTPAADDCRDDGSRDEGELGVIPATSVTPPPRLLSAGDRDTSWITPYHPLVDGVPTEEWWFPGEAGQTVTLEMRGDFRASLRVLEEMPDRQPGRELDRATGGANGVIRVVVTLPRTGSYRVYAGGVDVRETGTYTLTLRH